MIQIDTKSLQAYLSLGKQKLFLQFVRKGCAGRKLHLQTEIPEESVFLGCQETVELYSSQEDAKHFTGSCRATQTPKGWIFQSDEIQSRCSCGQSFDFEKKEDIASKHAFQEKIKLLQKKLMK